LSDAARIANLDLDLGDWRNNKSFVDELEKNTKNSKKLMDKLGSFQGQMQHKLDVQHKTRKELELLLKQLENEDTEAYKKLKDEEDKQKKMQEKLREMGVCPAGYEWLREGGGWRCAGGSHFVTDAELM